MTGVFTIPAGIPFAHALAKGVLAETKERGPLGLSEWRILLPTRRACRTLRNAFLQQSGGAPILLPRLQPLGDVEEDELAITLSAAGLGHEILNLPPAMPVIRRRMLLTQEVMKLGKFTRGVDQAMTLAAELGRLLDQVHTEGLDLSNIHGLVEDNFAAHWEITSRFIDLVLNETWPAILAQHGAIDAADRRNRLLRILTQHWRHHPPESPVIAAGSTGSIPAVRDLLSVIAQMEKGRVILPGLDQAMDRHSWAALDDAHPQAMLKLLLERLDVRREDVAVWPHGDSGSNAEPRRALATETMRPAPTTELWNRLDRDRRPVMEAALQGLERHDCDTPEEEARVIALALRHTLQTPGRTAALVTPDRILARRVAMTCRRWGLEIDDSAGVPLQETDAGIFLRLIVRCGMDRMAPGSLLSLLRHRHCRAGFDHMALEREASVMEKAILRGPKPQPGIAGLLARADQLKHKPTGGQCAALAARLERHIGPFLDLCRDGEWPAAQWVAFHIEAAEALAGGPDEPGAALLWRGESGEEAARFMASLAEDAPLMPALDAWSYLAILTQLMSTATVRPRYGTHPRLAILGQLEARLLQADTVILSGLNEGMWPPDPGHDPWMSRPMRARFDLPSPERTIGLAAHDFVQGFCAPHVILTRALRQDDAPTMPARWLQRLDAVLQAAKLELNPPAQPWLSIARSMDDCPNPAPVQRPAPKPPVEKRPRALPVTAIETWLQDPYAIYAKHVLNLRRLEPLEKKPDARARGIFLHEVLKDFVEQYPRDLPRDAKSRLIDMGQAHYKTLMDDSGFWHYWMPRFERIAEWLVERERVWRQVANPEKLECEGEIVLQAPAGPFRLTARADRIDRLRTGGMAVIDYKSGGEYTPAKIVDGNQPQLPLEAMILENGGFKDIAAAEVHSLIYWVLTGGRDKGREIIVADDKIRDAIRNARAGLEALIEAYDQKDMPYHSLPDPERQPRFQDYAHLARVQEWSVGEDMEEDAA